MERYRSRWSEEFFFVFVFFFVTLSAADCPEYFIGLNIEFYNNHKLGLCGFYVYFLPFVFIS